MVSSATATPFAPEPKKPEKPKLKFSCIVEPPPKRPKVVAPVEAPPASSATTPAVPPPAAPPAAAPVPLATPPAVPAPAPTQARGPVAPGQGPLLAPPAPSASGAATAATTVPPFGAGGSAAPYGAPTQAPFEFNAPPRSKARWFSWSTLILVVAGVAGYYQYQRMEQAKADELAQAMAEAQAAQRSGGGASRAAGGAGAAGSAGLAKAGAGGTKGGAAGGGAATTAGGGAGAAGSAKAGGAAGAAPAGEAPKMANFASPFTALKQAKATIKDAGERHKAAYDTVDAMLDDPTGGAADAIDNHDAKVKQEAADAAAKAAAAKAARSALLTGLPPGARLVDVKGAPIEIDAAKPPPSANFIIWARTVRIGGMRSGPVPRVLIGASSFAVGDMVESRSGIVFSGYDEATRLLYFTERDGGTIGLRR